MDDDLFRRRLRCAVGAGWWTVLIGILWMTLGWFWWWLIVSSGPLTKFAETMWGDIKIAEMKPFVVALFGAFELVLFICVLAMIFLSIWARKLRKANG